MSALPHTLPPAPPAAPPPSSPAHALPAAPRLPEVVRVALLATILAGFALRLLSLDFQSLWRDEVDAIYFALRPLAETLEMLTAMAQNGPLYFLTLRPWLSTVGSSEFALRLPSALAGVAAIPLLWQVGRRLVGGSGVRGAAGAPLLAALFLAINPYAIWYGQEGKMYTAITLLALLATWCWLRGVQQGGAWPWVGYALSVSLAMYTHLLMVLIIPVHLIWFVIAWPALGGAARGRRWGYLAALAALTLPYLPMIAWQWPMLRSSERLTGFNFIPLNQMVRLLLLNHARGYAPGDALLLLAPIYFLALLGLLLGWSELRPPSVLQPPGARPLVELQRWQRFGLLLVWLVAPLIGIWLLSLRQPVFTDRYIIWSAPALLLLMALGVEVLRNNLGQVGKAAAATAVLLLCAVWLRFDWQQATTVIKYDLRAAIRLVAAQRTPDDLLLLQIPHTEWSYRYYSSDQGTDPFAGSDARLGRWAGGMWTNNGLPDAQVTADVDAQMRSLTAGAGEIWLVLSEVEMWDTRRLMDAWLAANTELLARHQFQGVQVQQLRPLATPTP